MYGSAFTYLLTVLFDTCLVFSTNFSGTQVKKLGALLELIDILLRAFWMNIERAFGSLSEGCLMHLAERIHVVEFF